MYFSMLSTFTNYVLMFTFLGSLAARPGTGHTFYLANQTGKQLVGWTSETIHLKPISRFVVY
jgi:hypothetical protein